MFPWFTWVCWHSPRSQISKPVALSLLGPPPSRGVPRVSGLRSPALPQLTCRLAHCSGMKLEDQPVGWSLFGTRVNRKHKTDSFPSSPTHMNVAKSVSIQFTTAWVIISPVVTAIYLGFLKDNLGKVSQLANHCCLIMLAGAQFSLPVPDAPQPCAVTVSKEVSFTCPTTMGIHIFVQV